MPACFAILATLAAAFQGSFGTLLYIPVAIVFAASLFFGEFKFSKLTIPLALLAIWAPVSSLAHGLSADGLAAAMIPLVLLVMVLGVRALSEDGRSSFAVALCFGSAVLALAGVVCYSGVFASSWVNGKHLVYGFGEATVAAGWFAACTILTQAMLPRNRFLALALPFNVIGLMLTCSPLVIALWLLAELAILVRSRNDEQTVATIPAIAVSIALAVAMYYTQGMVVAAIAIAVLACAWGWFFEELQNALSAKPVMAVSLVLTMVAVIVGAWFSQRVQVELPLMTRVCFVEMGDALVCIAANPVFGLGAGEWNYLGPQYQSTVFGSMVVPNMFLHLGAESGVIALLLAIASAVVALVRSSKAGFPQLLAMVVLLVVACFTAAFNAVSLAALAVAIAFSDGEEPQGSLDIPAQATYAVGGVCCALLALALFGSAQVSMFQSKATTSDADAADITSTFAGEPSWVKKSPSARSLYDQWLTYELTSGSYEGRAAGLEAEQIFAITTDKNVYDCVAQAYLYGAQFEWDKGLEYLIEALEKNPHNSALGVTLSDYLMNTNCSEELVESALSLAETNGLSVEYTPLTGAEKQMFEEARQSYIDEYGQQ